jgi:transposase
MAKELLPDALWLRIAPLIPPEAPKPKGGRPRVSDEDPLRAPRRHSFGLLAA